jgi:hypothetical protein
VAGKSSVPDGGEKEKEGGSLGAQCPASWWQYDEMIVIEEEFRGRET